MDYIDQLVGVLDLISSKHVAGKTFIQKGIFLLQAGLKNDFGFNYKMHYYGPYSREVTDILDDLEDMNYINIGYDRSSQKYRISLTDAGKNYLQEKEQHKLPIQNLNIVLSLLRGASVETMELLSTILYFSDLTDNQSQCIEEVLIAKPQFEGKIDEIERGIELLKNSNVL